MKLVFVGNSGSGKTTLAERVALELEEAMHYTDLKSLPMPISTDPLDTIIEKQEMMRDRILETILSTDGGCYDRSIFDTYCYSNRFLGDCISKVGDVELIRKGAGHLKWSRLLLQREEENVDFYFYCLNLKEYNESNKVEDEYVVEKKRWGDLTLQWIYDTVRDVLLPKEKTFIVGVGDLESRVKWCLAKIKGGKNNGFIAKT